MLRMQADAAVSETAELRTLEEVFRWATRRYDRLMPADVAIQDEYTHDVIFVAADGSALVFDTT
jgi:hypothetical protein